MPKLLEVFRVGTEMNAAVSPLLDAFKSPKCSNGSVRLIVATYIC